MNWMGTMVSSFILQLLFLLSSLTITRVTQAFLDSSTCSTTGNYTTTSPFYANLDQLLANLALLATLKNSSFYNDTSSKVLDQQAYGLIMCYYHLTTPESCKACMDTVSRRITTECPNSTTAALWYDGCFIRYSNQNFFSIPSNVSYFLRDPNNASIEQTFKQVVSDLMNKLTTKVTSSIDPYLGAVGYANYTNTTSEKVYGLVECTKDLSAVNCRKCVEKYVGLIPSTCGAALGCRRFGESCYMRYEVYPFYNISSLPSPSPSPVPLATPTQPTDSQGSNSNSAVIIVVSVVAVVMFAILGVFFWRKSRTKTHGATGEDGVVVPHENIVGLEYILNPNTEYQVFDLITIKNATNNYCDMNKLGKGGFGPVYKGILSDGLEIAVKILAEGSRQGITEFKNEVDLLAKLKHKNLVQLLGCCVEKNQKMLCYEYLPNGSLEKILFEDQHKSGPLGWRVRFKIIEGISRGLRYLHEESRLKIIHRDLKASNILLDKDMNPKISDFGIARFFEEDQTHKVTSVIAGTFGYMPMEYILHGKYSAKLDVYSFGILVLEIVTGRQNSSFDGPGLVSNLIDHALRHWNNEAISQLKDPILENEYLDEIKKCVYIALLCVKEDPNDRPNMETVKNMLSGNSNIAMDLPLNLSVSKLVGFKVSDESCTLNNKSDRSEGESSYTRSTTKTSGDYSM